jgi:hypothetical protein
MQTRSAEDVHRVSANPADKARIGIVAKVVYGMTGNTMDGGARGYSVGVIRINATMATDPTSSNFPFRSGG